MDFAEIGQLLAQARVIRADDVVAGDILLGDWRDNAQHAVLHKPHTVDRVSSFVVSSRFVRVEFAGGFGEYRSGSPVIVVRRG